jgi:hypothetical protein
MLLVFLLEDFCPCPSRVQQGSSGWVTCIHSAAAVPDPKLLDLLEQASCLPLHPAYISTVLVALLQLHARLADLFRRGLSGESGPQKSKQAAGMHGRMLRVSCSSAV